MSVCTAIVRRMNLAVYGLNTAALLFQLAGAVLVALDVMQAQRNLTGFKVRLDEAAEKRQEHLDHLARQSGRSIPGFGGGSIKLPAIAHQAREQLADQLGPSGMVERQALTDFVQAQFAISKHRLWLGISLLFAGVIVGYTANMLAVG